MLYLESAIGGKIRLESWRRKKKDIAVSSIFTAGGDMDAHDSRIKRGYQGSLTIEATMVLTVVLFSISILISQVYQLHDIITGTMILEETLLHLRKERFMDAETAQNEAEAYGEKLGNPRLWLGKYEIETDVGLEYVSGTAQAGDWEQEIVIKQFHPGDFLLKYEKILEIGERLDDDGSGIQEGDESQLYGDSSGD